MLQVIVAAPPGLSGRFAAAAGHEPLSALPERARGELAELLERTTAFEDLPGWWQAALLSAEAARAGRAPAPRTCCGGTGERSSLRRGPP